MARKKQMSPEELALRVDAFKSFRDRRLEKQRELDELKKQENELKDQLLALLREANVGGIMGKLAQISVVEKTVPVVEDWDALYGFIRETGYFDLMQAQLSTTAVKARWELDDDVPGVTTETIHDLSVRKV